MNLNCVCVCAWVLLLKIFDIEMNGLNQHSNRSKETGRFLDLNKLHTHTCTKINRKRDDHGSMCGHLYNTIISGILEMVMICSIAIFITLSLSKIRYFLSSLILLLTLSTKTSNTSTKKTNKKTAITPFFTLSFAI